MKGEHRAILALAIIIIMAYFLWSKNFIDQFNSWFGRGSA